MTHDIGSKRIRYTVLIAGVIAVSIGNLINYRSITIYKVFAFFLPFFFVFIFIREKRRLSWNMYFTLFVIFIGANLCMFGMLKNPHSIREKLFFIGRLAGHCMVMYLLFNLVQGEEEGRINKLLAPMLYVSSTVNLVFNGLQAVKAGFLPAHLAPVQYYNLYRRGTGLFMDPNYNGLFICICIFLLLHLRRKGVIRPVAFTALLIGNAVAFCLSLSIGAFAGLLVAGAAVIFIDSRWKKRIVFISIIAVVIASALVTLPFIKSYNLKTISSTTLKYKLIFYAKAKLTSGSSGLRLDQYKVAVNAFTSNPIWGIGTLGFIEDENYRRYREGLDLNRAFKRGTVIHSNLFAVLGENGIIGFVPYGALVFFALLLSWRLYRNDGNYLPFLGMEIALFINSNIINTLYFNFYWFVLMFPFLLTAAQRKTFPLYRRINGRTRNEL